MEWTRQMQKAIAYMEAHMLEEILFDDVARHVCISSYEFHRAFSFLTGMTPGAYIRSRRLSMAGREILETDGKITDIALKYLYDTPESFTKAFTRFHGVAPKTARETGAKLVLFNPLLIKLTVEGGKSMDYRIVKTNEKKFLALIRDFKNEIINDDENHDIPDFWDECSKEHLLDPIYSLNPEGKRDLYGLCTPTENGKDTFEYGIGVLIDEKTKAFNASEMENRGFRVWEVKPGTYVVFDCIGTDGSCISETWSKFYKEFLPQMGYSAAEETDYEIYYQKGKPGVFCELWIPIRKNE